MKPLLEQRHRDAYVGHCKLAAQHTRPAGEIGRTKLRAQAFSFSSLEVITSVQRRRRWSAEEKQRIVAESTRPGRTASQVARAHGIAPSQLFTWRCQVLSAAMGGEEHAERFVAVALAEAPSAPAVAAVAASKVADAEDGRIEITLPDGVRLSVGKAVEAETLRRVLRALASR